MSSSPTARDVMLRHPRTLTPHASIAEARAGLSGDHVHMVLLTDGPRLVGTLTRADLPPSGTSGAALAWSKLTGRTVSPDASADAVQRALTLQSARRVAVVGDDGSLLGLMCLKRTWSGFCSDTDAAGRFRRAGADERASP